jgi:Ca2+:H+ antiporter
LLVTDTKPDAQEAKRHCDRCFVAPPLALVAPALGQSQFRLVFSQAEMWMLFGAVLLGATVATTGQSNWFKGAQLLALYCIIAAVLYLIPADIR